MYVPKKALNSFQWSDRSYRRGLVLGLTVAELFLLLLFLLLLALALLNKQWRNEEKQLSKEKEEIAKELADNRVEISAFEIVKQQFVDNGVDPEKFDELILVYSDYIRDENQLEGLERELEEEKSARQSAEEKLSYFEDEDISDVIQENKSLKEKVKEQTSVIGTLSGRGRDPSCWATYATSDEHLEKVEFLFNVGIFDKYLVVNDRALTNSPKKRLFSQEKARLPLGSVRWDKPMSDAEFLAATRKLFKLGKHKKIRDYSCVFHVLVWDMTSPQGKLADRWKNVMGSVLAQRFYTLPVSYDRWPGPIQNSRL